MAKKKASEKAARKPARKRPVKKKAAKKKVSGKRSVKKKAAKKKKTTKKSIRKASGLTTRSGRTPIKKKVMLVEPGPPPAGIPPVEEPAANEEAVGTVTHYYSHLAVAVVQINKSSLKTGDTIRVKGHSTDFIQLVESMEFEHQHVDQASAGQSVGIKVKEPVREHDIVYVQK